MIFKGKKGVACLVFAYSVMIPSTSSKLGTGATNYITYIYVFIAMRNQYITLSSRSA
jgi:hypothetical protein